MDASVTENSLPRKPGVLAVDDERSISDLLNKGLALYGFRVFVARGGPEAVELYRRHQDVIDVVLLDVQMPKFDGPWTLRALRQINPAVRTCFMTGFSAAYSQAELVDMGAARVLHKPFTMPAVAQALTEVAAPAELSSKGETEKPQALKISNR